MIVRWKNNPEIANFLDNFFRKDLFDDGNTAREGTSMAAVNICETIEAYNIEVAAPGLKREDFNINLENDVLSIACELNCKESEGKKYSRKEFCYESFKRSFTLPKDVDIEKIGAKYTDGILLITLPKREEAKEKPKREITIS